VATITAGAPSTNLPVSTPFVQLASDTPGTKGDQVLSYVTFDGINGSNGATVRSADQKSMFRDESLAELDRGGPLLGALTAARSKSRFLS
jgi:hypothetical protein